jgi:hypothetical protein
LGGAPGPGLNQHPAGKRRSSFPPSLAKS